MRFLTLFELTSKSSLKYLISPESLLMRSRSSLIVVVFPAPFAPTNPVMQSLSREKPISFSLKLPKDLFRFFTSRTVNGHLRIPFFGHEKSPRKGRRVYEQELCISSYLLYASLSWCMLRYGYSSFHSHRLRWLMPSPVVQGDGVFGNYHL
jgi:hypothetical protein